MRWGGGDNDRKVEDGGEGVASFYVQIKQVAFLITFGPQRKTRQPFVCTRVKICSERCTLSNRTDAAVSRDYFLSGVRSVKVNMYFYALSQRASGK